MTLGPDERKEKGGDGDAVNSHIHMPQTGNGSTVGGPTATAGGLHAGNMLGGGM